MSKTGKDIRKQIGDADWDYAGLTKAAKEYGGPEEMVDDLVRDTRINDLTIAGIVGASIAAIVSIKKFIKYKHSMNQDKKILIDNMADNVDIESNDLNATNDTDIDE